MNQDERDKLKATVYAEHYSQPVATIDDVVEYVTDAHPWAVKIADRGLVFCDSHEEAVAAAKGSGFIAGERRVMRLYAWIERPDGRKFARYI